MKLTLSKITMSFLSPLKTYASTNLTAGKSTKSIGNSSYIKEKLLCLIEITTLSVKINFGKLLPQVLPPSAQREGKERLLPHRRISHDSSYKYESKPQGK